MKFLKPFIIGGVATLAFVIAASAQTPIYVVGAPAFRQSSSKAIFDTLKQLSPAGTTITVAADANGNADYTVANQVNFLGGSINGVSVIVQVSYTGSVTGVQSVASGNLPVLFLPANTAAGNSAPDPTKSGNPNVSAQPQITLADTYQASTPFTGTNSLTGTSVTYTTLSDAVVGIVPYNFVANVSAPNTLTNITTKQAQALYTNGRLSLEQFTGNTADRATRVYATGRDTGSGSRLILLAETGLGLTHLVQQYQVTLSGSNATGQVLYPAGTVNGISHPKGDTGYPSFSGLSAVATSTSIGTGLSNALYIAYFNQFDSATVIAGGAKVLSYNGVLLGSPSAGAGGTAQPSLAEGQYSFWSYEHVLYNPSIADPGLTFVNGLVSTFSSTDATVLLTDVNVTRSGGDGSLVVAQYTF